MLQTDEVDEDFFTPIASTSLANIFGHSTQNKQETDNEKLRYTPPKPQQIQKQPSQSKATECLYACALTAHEWSNNIYTSRGKLGFAIIKIQKSGEHNIILYDSNKTTLSSTPVSPKLEISIKNNNYISYYDTNQKYWSMYASVEDSKKILEILTKFDVNIKQTNEVTEKEGPPEPIQKENTDVSIPVKFNLESDTDSSINKKTKASILNRMANMGQSVFPVNALPANRTSDSSDTNETDSHPKVVRHKPVKSVAKRNNLESNDFPDSYQKKVIPKAEQSIDNIVSSTQISTSRQLIPVANTSLLTGSCSNEMGLFMSEQRISNSELRINMNRIIDKADKILDKVNNCEQKGANVQTEILMKLLTEYENKIKTYEDLLKQNKFDVTRTRLPNTENDTEILRSTIQNLEQRNKEKDNEILNFQNVLKAKTDNDDCSQAQHTDVLHQKISDLENSLAVKNYELKSMTEKCDSLSSNTSINDSDLGALLKNIMNDTFQTISINFENSEVYSGERVKKIIASVIKKITIQKLSEL